MHGMQSAILFYQVCLSVSLSVCPMLILSQNEWICRYRCTCLSRISLNLPWRSLSATKNLLLLHDEAAIRRQANGPQCKPFHLQNLLLLVPKNSSVRFSEIYFTKQYNLVPANGRWWSAAGKVRKGLAESNGSLPPGLWLRSPAGWLPRPGISSGILRSFRLWVYLYCSQTDRQTIASVAESVISVIIQDIRYQRVNKRCCKTDTQHIGMWEQIRAKYTPFRKPFT